MPKTGVGKLKKLLPILCIGRSFNYYQVIRLGFEPRTHTLKVYCSTS